MKINSLLLTGALVAALAIPAVAHHSYAMFDRSKSTTVEGTVKKFQWTNPHSWIYVSVTDANGQTVEWPVEAGSPGGLSRQGWTPKTLTPGMKVKMTMHPLADGKPGGQFMSVTLPDGKQMGDPDGRAEREGGAQ
jgi:hypothetical protein